MRIPKIFTTPTLVLRRQGPEGRAVWYIACAGKLTSTRCEAQERSAAEAVLACHRDRLLAGITGGGPTAKPRPTLERLLRDHLDQATCLRLAPKERRPRRRHGRFAPALFTMIKGVRQ